LEVTRETKTVFTLVVDALKKKVTTPVTGVLTVEHPDDSLKNVSVTVTVPGLAARDRIGFELPIGKDEMEGEATVVLDIYGLPEDPGLPVASAPAVRQQRSEATGYVGLANQGATCYMNAMLQSLFHIPAFRRIVYQMPTTGAEDAAKSIPLNLQRLFCRMQLGKTAVSTRALTHSFGWGDADALTQHDTQEFCRVLMDNLETKLARSPLDGRIAALFRGRYQRYVRCVNIDYGNTHEEFFYDLSIQIRDCPDLASSFRKWIEWGTLEGNDQWDAGEHGKQDARIGCEFLEFPPVLQLHLRRFEFDYEYERNVKINERFAFPTEIDLEPYLAQGADRTKSNVFDLYAVLVHAGDVNYGHYYAYLRPTTGPQWYEFNDSWVRFATPADAIEANFGGGGRYRGAYDKGVSAYVLVYVRREDAAQIMSPVEDGEVPEHVRDCLNHPEDGGTAKAHARDSIQIFDRDGAAKRNALTRKMGFQREDCLRLLKFDGTETYAKVYEKVAELFEVPVDEIRLWQGYCSRQASPKTLMPCIASVPTTSLGWYTLFMSRKRADEPVLLSHNIITVYLKFFYPGWAAPLQYLGAFAIPASSKFGQIVSEVNSRLGAPVDTPLIAYEENITNTVRRLNVELDDSIESKSCNISTGQTILFEAVPGTDIPDITFVPDPPIDADAGPSDAQAASDVKVCRFSVSSIGDPLERWVWENVAGHLSITLLAFSEPETPVAIIEISKAATFDDLVDFIISIADVALDRDRDTVVLYKRDFWDNGPSSVPLTPTRYPILTYLFSGHEKVHCLYYRLLKGVTADEFAKGILLTIDFSEDSKVVSKSVEIAMPSNALFPALKARIESMAVLSGPLRYLQLASAAISVPTTESWVCQATKYFVAVEPEEEKNLLPTEKLLWLTLTEIDSSDFLSPIGFPSSLKVGVDLRLGEAKSAIAKKFSLTEDQQKKARYFSGDRWVSFSPPNALKDDTLLSSIGDRWTLFVLVDAKRKPNRWRPVEESIKIEN
jgi:ubiquitin carboxyl-terminal hydrolase 7